MSAHTKGAPVLTFIIAIYVGLALGYLIGQTAGRWSQQSRYEEGWYDGLSYGGTDTDPDIPRRTP